MLELIQRCPEFVSGYREYCREMYAKGVTYFRPTPPETIDEGWFQRTKPWYDQREQGLVPGVARSYHYWAVEGDRFIGEFQCRTDFTEKVLNDIGSIGYAVRPSEWGKGYGTEILRHGLALAKSRGAITHSHGLAVRPGPSDRSRSPSSGCKPQHGREGSRRP